MTTTHLDVSGGRLFVLDVTARHLEANHKGFAFAFRFVDCLR